MMAANGPGASHMSHQTASIIDILLAYGTRGGAIYAAYRHPDNPLLLTDIRWQSTTGEAIEAHRSPDDMSMVREEREAWAQVALRSTTLRPDAVGPQAPWLQAPLDPREAYDLATRAQRAREASMPPSQHPYTGIPSGAPMRPGSYSPGTPPGLTASSAPAYPPQSHGLSGDGSQSFENFENFGSYSGITARPQPFQGAARSPARGRATHSARTSRSPIMRSSSSPASKSRCRPS